MIIARNVVLHGGLAGTIDAPGPFSKRVQSLRSGLGIARICFQGSWRAMEGALAKRRKASRAKRASVWNAEGSQVWRGALAVRPSG